MTQKYTREQFEADLKARREKEAKEQEERKERTEREAARRAWVADGGREADFARAWPGLRDEARNRCVMDADSRARASQRASGISRI
jgi:hypothetical protein